MQVTPVSLNNVSAQQQEDCPQLPGTLIRINIPPGAVINLLNLIEISSPGGICLIVRIPLLNGGNGVSTLVNAIKQAGGTVEFIEQ
ncbi:hypothetical protein QBE52_04520 [Clostridiaceae bacterium 35-E11]